MFYPWVPGSLGFETDTSILLQSFFQPHEVTDPELRDLEALRKPVEFADYIC